MRDTTARWRDRLSNVPIPEQHVVPLVAAGMAERIIRFRLPGPPIALRVAGAVLLISAWTLVWQAWRETRGVRLTDPDRLVTTGPYESSRHPMYRAWSRGHVGWALLTRSGWALAALVPARLAVSHQVDAEEALLRRRFGVAYERYAEVVGR